jgi:Cu+-exporting ATPase
LAHAVLAEAGQTPLRALKSFKSHPGQGLEATLDDRILFIGNRSLLNEKGFVLRSLEDQAVSYEKDGATVMWIAEKSPEKRLLGLIAVADAIKDDAASAVARLKSLGIETIMLTGDNPRSAASVALAAGVDRVIAEVLPEDKAREVSYLQDAGRVVAMVGDGINDAPALAAADIGIAMGTGTDIAMHTAGITLMRGDLQLIAASIKISSATYRKIRQNLFWAFIYNIIGIALAAAGLLSPLIAGIAMAMSSVSVVSNSLLLRWWKV